MATAKVLAKVLKGDFKWHGPNRRLSGERRDADRRAEVRYEPHTVDRRDGNDRRQDNLDLDSYRRAKHLQFKVDSNTKRES